jgi:hypothetical protein
VRVSGFGIEFGEDFGVLDENKNVQKWNTRRGEFK